MRIALGGWRMSRRMKEVCNLFEAFAQKPSRFLSLRVFLGLRLILAFGFEVEERILRLLARA
jgi:hypothetical protein